MKKIMFSMATAIGLLFASCNNNKTEGTHQHEDGSVHSDHEHPALDTAKQEEFKVDSVGTDSAHVHDESKPHTH